LALFGRRPPEHVVGIVIAGGRKPAQLRTRAPQQNGTLFDDLVGTSEQCGRNLKPERLGRLEVDDRLILGRRLHRQIGQVRLLNAFALH
jgi:hypothetical protein